MDALFSGYESLAGKGAFRLWPPQADRLAVEVPGRIYGNAQMGQGGGRHIDDAGRRLDHAPARRRTGDDEKDGANDGDIVVVALVFAAVISHHDDKPVLLTMKAPVYYGWIILPVVVVIHLACGPGQTIGISVFNPSIRESLGLSHSALSGAYMLATLLAGTSSLESMVVFGAVFGAAQGIEITAMSATLPRYFGRAHLGKIRGWRPRPRSWGAAWDRFCWVQSLIVPDRFKQRSGSCLEGTWLFLWRCRLPSRRKK